MPWMAVIEEINAFSFFWLAVVVVVQRVSLFLLQIGMREPDSRPRPPSENPFLGQQLERISVHRP